MNQSAPPDPREPEIPSPPQRTPPRGGDWRDLALFGGFVLALLGLSWVAQQWLREWKSQADALPVLRYEQPTWSDHGATLAYLLLQGEPGSPEPRSRQLWTVSRFGDDHRLLADLPPGELRIVGWLGGEERVVLEAGGARDGVVLLDLAADGSGGRRLRFPGRDLRLVGRGEKELYFARTRPGKAAGGGVDLLYWTPGAERLRSLVTIPVQEGESVAVESVVAAPDGRRMAVVLRADPPEGPLGVWILRREDRSLTWTTISEEGARTLRADWSPDSRSLVAVAWLPEFSELFLVEDGPDPRPTRLRAASGPDPFTPLWPRDGKTVLLQEGVRVLEYDFQQQKAELVLDPQTLGYAARDLVLSPLGSLAAFHAPDGDTDDLYVMPLRNGKPDAVARSGERREVHATLLYEIADGMEYATHRWLGGGL